MSAPLPSGKFQDHYAVLGVHPKASTEEIHKAYSALAARYSPRNPATRDHAKYDAVTLAYEILSNPETRQAFDALLPKEEEQIPAFSGPEFFESVHAESHRRLCILCLLYDRRRHNPANPSVPVRHIEAMVNFPAEAMFFSIWYLKHRNWIAMDDKSGLQITAEGMDYLEQNLPPQEAILALLKPAASAAAKAG